ncbi:PH domain-containing protein [Actinoplanes bogorensis]|uniref:PH domain-containing protein n=1 Tax=Paractinoplanes bogorensis TaxID=1610840 RepID=A0ABS5YKJ6_9ACTN|nr:PH domain-containing protein [Actinoplanes bogorensis]MBU2663984.1 PH domain-containing protein [Actinoplanes bogorensis]
MPTVLRPPVWMRVLPSALFLLLAVVLIGGGLDEGSWLVPGGLATGAVAVAVAVRVWVLRVEIRPTGLVLVNWLRTVRVAWPEIYRCGTDDEGVRIEMADGRQLRASAFQHGTRAIAVARKPAREAAKRMEEARRRHRS